MSRSLTRLSLFIRIWFRSYYAILLMLLIPFVAVVIYNQSTYTIGDLVSIVFEEAAPIWFVLILQWCLSIDVDSKFHMQVMTYPIARWKFLMERLLFAAVIFISLLGIVSLVLMPFMGGFAWQSLVFTIPVYITFAGIIVAGTVLGNHSVGGILAGIIFWLVSLSSGEILLYLNPVLLDSPNVYQFANDKSGFFSIENRWIIYNRLFYMGIGVLLIGLAIFRFNRKSA